MLVKVNTVTDVFSIYGFFSFLLCVFKWNFLRADAVKGALEHILMIKNML